MHPMMDKAIAGIVLDYPFFAAKIMRAVVVEDPTCPTLGWTNGVKIGYNPDLIDKLTLGQVKFFNAHEALHIYAKHDLRRDGRDFEKWNIACDYEVNGILMNARIGEPIDGMCYNPAYYGMPAEDIFELLPPGNKGGNGKNGKGDGKAIDEVRDHPFGDPQGNSQKQAPDRAQQDAAKQARDIENIADARGSQNRGFLPDEIARQIEQLVRPKVDWKTVLRDFVEQNSRSNYSWARPNRRYMQQGLYLPTLSSKDIGEIVVSIDTSGSVGDDDLTQFVSELNDILDGFDTVAHVLPVDTYIHDYRCYTKNDLPIQAGVTGGGGTSFAKPFEFTEENGINPCCMVYLTDGYCDEFPEQAPNYPTLWVISRRHEFTPPFGEVIMMRQD